MDCFTDTDPRKIIAKIKLHLLCHLPEDVNRFGPLGILFNFNVQPYFQSGTPPGDLRANTHSFHNLHILYEVIPSWLIKPVEKFEDRCTKHKELAARAQREHAQRRRKNAAMQQARRQERG
ncbi:hypothetical protein V8E54_011466 [Elaphomyces granulatus]